ncbi:MAG: spermidine synthase, partial [Burkholderiaceae bacterium]
MRRKQKAAPVTLSEEDGIRYLHFGTEWIQGGMRVARPFALELEYQRQMMATGLFLPEPRRIVQLGLGAAALTKFCWREVASASVVAVELSLEVIEAARAWFCLPPNDARLSIVNADAREFISHPR